jgi:diguanylate cyclase (GGDEF)-like protein
MGALLYIDIDNFKSVNDVHGHQRGDAVLTEVTALLREATGPKDLRGRIGGDEFVVWLVGADGERGEVVASALAERGRALAVHSSAPDRPTGLSVGVAVRPPGSTESIEAVVERADQAMYRAKAAGRKAGAGGGWALSDGGGS